MKKFASFALIASLAATSAWLVFGCSNQGEGDRCSVLNGDDDCQSGLRCTPRTELTNSNSDLCCPPDRSISTNDLCKQTGARPTDAAVPTIPSIDSSIADSSADAASTDAAGDAPGDAPTDAPPLDASSDAPAE